MTNESIPDRVERYLTICIARINAGVSEASNNFPVGPLAATEEDWIRDFYRPHFTKALEEQPDRWGREGAWVLRWSRTLGVCAGENAIFNKRTVPSAQDVQQAAEYVNSTACRAPMSASGSPGEPHPAGVWCGT